MGSKSVRDSDSPSASAFSLSHLRSSRRSSLASLSSNTQVDKETLSHALDQIHSAASQTNTLTIFNEYTSPPSSSSGTESKGLASELHGGLSGLYSRFRASVGNVKDAVTVGSEDTVPLDASKSFNGALESPTLSAHDGYGADDLANAGLAKTKTSLNSGQQSPSFAPSNPKGRYTSEQGQRAKPTKIALDAAAIPSVSVPKSFTKSGNPLASLTQANRPTTIGPALAEVNVGAFKQTDQTLNNVSEVVNTGHRQSWIEDHNARVDPGNVSILNTESDTVDVRKSSEISNPSNGMVSDQSGRACTDTRRPDGLHADKSPSVSKPQVAQAVAQASHALMIDAVDKIAAVSSSDDEANGSRENLTIITSSSNVQYDVLNTSILKQPTLAAEHGGYQHLELPLQKDSGIPSNAAQYPQISNQSSAEPEVILDSSDTSAAHNLVRDVSVGSAHARSDANETARASDSKGNVSRDLRVMSVFSQVKNKVLNKEYWMKDENAKDCFYCGDTFSTFRRKHHCRTCGQIFDAKCTSLLPGSLFGQSSSLRVCKPCESIINEEDDSSDLSDDAAPSIHGIRPRHGSTGASDVLTGSSTRSRHPSNKTPRRDLRHADFAIPTMSIAAIRKAGRDSNRKPTVLEIDSERTLTRPSSSKSLKSSSGKSYHSGHRRHNSRQLLQRTFGTVDEDNAPFHQDPGDEKSRSRHLPAFHDDNIIDPDLAPFLSDEGSSEDEQLSIMAALNGDGLSKARDHENQGMSGLFASSKKFRSRPVEKSTSGVTFTTRDADSQSISSQRIGNTSRSLKRRNLSVTGNTTLRPSPRSFRNSVAAPYFGTGLHESTSNTALAQSSQSGSPGKGPRMIRSSSMRGSAAPAVELNNASLRHVRKLLHQLLEDSNIPNVASWEKALVPILLQATDDVSPDVQNGEEIDIRHYIKLKKIPGGQPGDSSYVSGVVCSKNLALKGMPRSISHPNILILSFSLEYARPQLHFMSLEPVIRQEREFLQNVVNRIAALRPQLLLVERNVSGLALEFLHQANIATAYNVKTSVIEAVSRCCQTRIISSIDKLAIKPAQAGRCESFYLKTYMNRGRKKTYMYISGCAKELGCTIVLRGDDQATLSRMKTITEFMVYVVYSLKLETCLMRDEFALIPSNTELGTLSTERNIAPQPFQNILASNSLADKLHTGPGRSGGDSSTQQSGTKSLNEGLSQGQSLDQNSPTERGRPALPDEESVPDDIPLPTFYGDMVEEHKTKILSASPFVKFAQPYLLMQAREQERRLAYMRRLRDQDILEDQTMDEKSKPQKFDLIRPEVIHERVETTSKKVREVLRAVHDAEYDKTLYNYQTKRRQWETYVSESNNLFDPYTHQNIAVLFSLVCTVTTTPCDGPDVIAYDFYNRSGLQPGYRADFTLGQIVEDLCIGASDICMENGCERTMSEHHRQYAHGEAQISVFVEHCPCKLRGLQDTILMWSTCRTCGKETQVLPMSESSWKYSFGKYLELSFWSSDLHARAGICPHDLHRDHVRYFGFKDMALRVQYDLISLVDIIVPRPRITWKVDSDLRFKNDLFRKIEDRLNRFMLSVKARIRNINTESVLPEKISACKEEVDRMSQRASEEHIVLIRKLREKYLDSKHFEIIPLNRAIRATQEKVAEWDNTFADFDQNFLPSEKDIRRLATLQLKKIFLDRDDSDTSLTSIGNDTATTVQGVPKEKIPTNESPALTPQTRTMSPEKAHNMLAAVVENNVGIEDPPDRNQSAPTIAVLPFHTEQEAALESSSGSAGIRHLDLALHTEVGRQPKDGSPTAAHNVQQSAQMSQEDQLGTKSKTPRLLGKGQGDVGRDSDDTEAAKSSPKAAEFNRLSNIPRPIESNPRRTKTNASPTLSRTHTQPTSILDDRSTKSGKEVTPELDRPAEPDRPSDKAEEIAPSASAASKQPSERLIQEKSSINALKPNSVGAHSMIPRSINSRRHDSRVSNLAKHFEQLSREFEKERIRERRQRAAKSRKARAYPMAASKPIIHIYHDVEEAVGEKEPSDEDPISSDHTAEAVESVVTSGEIAKTTGSQELGHVSHAEGIIADNVESEEVTVSQSRFGSDVEGEDNSSDEDLSNLEDIQIPGEATDHHALSPEEAQLDVKLDLPKHEKTSLMKMLTNFWAERSASGWQPLEYPLNATDHIFVDSDIIVREDEPSSLIAFVLDSRDYEEKLKSTALPEDNAVKADETQSLQTTQSDHDNAEMERALLRATSNHIKFQFTEGSAKMLCKVFFAEQFHALRKKCGVSERIVESLSGCAKWDGKGGKSKSVFLKTLDDRFVLKSLSSVETKAFIEFAADYFHSASRALFRDMPSVIAKMLGLYQVTIKNPITGTEFNHSLLLMENLMYDRSPDRIFDLKGSMRNRRIDSTGEQNEVLLDENMVDFIYEKPLFSRDHDKRVYTRSIWNDTLFLSHQNVMDYSLLVGVEDKRKEIAIGLVDCIRTYTWDKKLENWIKDRGKHKPTVLTPREYKRRFRQAMTRYVLCVPSCWHQFEGMKVERLPSRYAVDDPKDDERESQIQGE